MRLYLGNGNRGIDTIQNVVCCDNRDYWTKVEHPELTIMLSDVPLQTSTVSQPQLTCSVPLYVETRHHCSTDWSKVVYSYVLYRIVPLLMTVIDPKSQSQGHSVVICLKANISQTVHTIHSTFGSRQGFMGSADRMALFAVRQNLRWRLSAILEWRRYRANPCVSRAFLFIRTSKVCGNKLENASRLEYMK